MGYFGDWHHLTPFGLFFFFFFFPLFTCSSHFKVASPVFYWPLISILNNLRAFVCKHFNVIHQLRSFLRKRCLMNYCSSKSQTSSTGYLFLTFPLKCGRKLKIWNHRVLLSLCLIKKLVLWFLPINGTIPIAVCNSERMMQRINSLAAQWEIQICLDINTWP